MRYYDCTAQWLVAAMRGEGNEVSLRPNRHPCRTVAKIVPLYCTCGVFRFDKLSLALQQPVEVGRAAASGIYRAGNM